MCLLLCLDGCICVFARAHCARPFKWHTQRVFANNPKYSSSSSSSLSLVVFFIFDCVCLGMPSLTSSTFPSLSLSHLHFFLAYVCHVHSRLDNLCGVVIADAEYPSRVAFSLLNKVSVLATATGIYIRRASSIRHLARRAYIIFLCDMCLYVT